MVKALYASLLLLIWVAILTLVSVSSRSSEVTEVCLENVVYYRTHQGIALKITLEGIHYCNFVETIPPTKLTM